MNCDDDYDDYARDGWMYTASKPSVKNKYQ